MIKEPLPIFLNKPDKRGFFNEIQIGRFTKISFKRTLRVPEDGKTYKLPAGLGSFPIHRVEDFADKVPNSWLKEGGFFIPMYQKEALYIKFEGVDWHPNIIKICVGKINAITADNYSNELSQIKQDYVIIPTQPWLDGVAISKNVVRQFVAMPLGQGYTIEAQMTDEEIYGGFQITVIDAKDGKFPERDIESEEDSIRSKKAWMKNPVLFQIGGVTEKRREMGIAPGGMIEQQIFRDPHGPETWDLEKKCSFTIHLVNSLEYKSITGFDPPAVPINASTYQSSGIPWFDYYNETQPVVKPHSTFKKLISVATIECKRFFQKKENEIIVDEQLIEKIKTPTKKEACEKFRASALNYFAKKDWISAKKHISYAIDLADKITENDYLIRSFCNIELENYKEADVDAQLALEKNIYSINSVGIRKKCLIKLEQYDEMVKFAEELIDTLQDEFNNKSTHSSEDFNLLMRSSLELKAIGLMLSGHLDEATNHANLLKRKYPNDPQSCAILAQIKGIRLKQKQAENHILDSTRKRNGSEMSGSGPEERL